MGPDWFSVPTQACEMQKAPSGTSVSPAAGVWRLGVGIIAMVPAAASLSLLLKKGLIKYK